MKNKAFLLSLGAILLINILFIGGQLPYFLFYVYSGLLAFPLLHGLLGRIKIQASLHLPTKDLVAGEEITLTTKIRNSSRYSFPRLEYRNTLSSMLSGQDVPITTFHIASGETYHIRQSIKCKRRGHYQLGQTELIIKDVLNFFEFKKSIKAPISLKVYPKLIPLSEFTVEAGQSMGELIVDDPVFQDYTAIDTLRTYRDGDPVKKIHWHASAKQDRLIVKDFERHGDAEIILIMNHSLKDYKNDCHRLLEDKLVEVSASISHFCLNNRLTLHHMVDKNSTFTKMTGDNNSYLRLFLDQLILFKPSHKTDFYTDIETIRPAINQGATIIFLTPHISKELAKVLLDLKMHNSRPMVVWLNNLATDSTDYKEQHKLLNKLSMENLAVTIIHL